MNFEEKLFSALDYIWKFVDNIERKIILLQEKFDPIPNPKKDETYEQWLNRIDIRYALRYARLLELNYFNLDMVKMARDIKMQKTKTDKKNIKLIYSVLALANARGQENIQIVMTRKENEERLKKAQSG